VKFEILLTQPHTLDSTRNGSDKPDNHDRQGWPDNPDGLDRLDDTNGSSRPNDPYGSGKLDNSNKLVKPDDQNRPG